MLIFCLHVLSQTQPSLTLFSRMHFTLCCQVDWLSDAIDLKLVQWEMFQNGRPADRSADLLPHACALQAHEPYLLHRFSFFIHKCSASPSSIQSRPFPFPSSISSPARALRHTISQFISLSSSLHPAPRKPHFNRRPVFAALATTTTASRQSCLMG